MTDARDRVIVACRNVWKVYGPHPRAAVEALQAHAADASPEPTAGHVVAVRDVSFDVYQGETFVVMGLSGSGKSTLLRCIPRLITPTHGRITVDGVEMTSVDKRRLRHLRRHTVSMVFQHFGLFPHRRVIDNVAYGLEIQGIGKAKRMAKARQVLEVVGLAQWEDAYPGQLSGGMQQRVGLARALAVDPAILLFDEPFSALDPVIRREMQDELLRLESQMDKTLIFITHDMSEAVKLGDRIAIMKDGAFVQIGTAAEIVLHPADEYVADFVKDVPRTKVLTAAAVMRPVNGTSLAEQAVGASTVLDDLLPILAHSKRALPVLDEASQLVGCVDHQDVMLALTGNLAPQANGHAA